MRFKKIGALIIMLKKNLLANVSMIVLSFGTISLTQSLAEEINYTGTVDDYNSKLINDPVDTTKKSLYSSSFASGNIIIVTDPEDLYSDYKAPDNIYGGISSTNNVTSNNVIIKQAYMDNTNVYGGKAIGNNNVAEGNVVTLTTADADVEELYGGSSLAGAINNTVNVVESQVNNRIIGGHSEYGVVKGNNVNLSSAITNYAYGGYSDHGTVSGNTITIKDLYENADPNAEIPYSDIAGQTVGGYSETGLVDGNKVLLRGNLYGDEIKGGWSESGDVTNNIVDINRSGTFDGEEVCGGCSETGNVSGNEVRISGVKNIYYEIYGGKTYGEVSNNKVAIDTVKNLVGQVYGGYSEWDAAANNAANNNTVFIKDVDEVEEQVAGGTGYGEVSGNRVEIINSNFASSVYGGQAYYKGDAKDNIVSVSGNSSFADEVVGGYTSDTTALNNEVMIGGTTKTENKVYGGFSEEGNAIGNKVTFTDNAEAEGFVIGGYSGYGDANNNTVSISANNIIKADIYGGEVDKGNAIGNTVTLHGLPTVEGYDAARSTNKLIEIDGAVYGGYDGNLDSPANAGSDPNHDLFTGNTLNLVQFRGKIYGVGNFENYNWTLPKDVVNNDVLVKISGTAPVNLLNTKHTFSMINDGNRLSVGDRVVLIDSVTNAPALSNIEVKQGNFLIYDMKAEEVASTETGHNEFVLTAQQSKDTTPNPEDGGDNNGTGSGDNNNDHVGSGSNGDDNNGHDAPPPDHNGSSSNDNADKDDNHHNASDNGDNNGDHHDTGSNDHADNNAGNDKEGDKNHVAGGDNASTNDKDHATSEPTIPTEPVAPTEPNKELAGRINPQTKAFSEGRAAALGFVNQGADLIAEAGIRAARTSVAEGASNAGQMNLTPFMVMNGGSSRYKTGSHVDVDGFNMVVGLATGFDLLNQHPVTIGAFFEYGRGTYNTYNSFATYASVHGDGDTHYTGGGILGRIEFAGTGLGWVKKLNADQADGLYAEASFRAGRIDSDFDTNDILGGRGESSSYDSGANYYGLHGGIGYVLNFDERNSVDIYGRYLWTRIDSETVNVGRDRLRFDEADSSRIRIGARYTTVYNDQLKPYIGVAYEYEFDGEVAARAYGLKLNKPSLEGDTGIFEAGVTLKPISTIDALSVDVTGQGFVGQRQGGGGGLKIKYQF